MDRKTKELVALGASVSANCHPCVKHHFNKAKKMNISDEKIKEALEVGRTVRGGAARNMDELLEEL
ncbi:MAG: carboxymuconolactone decarboxylase family protein [Elusimicrobiota bacterium]